MKSIDVHKNLYDWAKQTRLFGPALCFMEYFVRPAVGWGADPMNGQQGRSEIVAALFKCFSFDAVVETGSYRGATTEYLQSASGLEVFSCEIASEYYWYCRARFMRNAAVHIFNGDSRNFLDWCKSHRSLAGRKIFFYLDAHWSEDLPLWEELEKILRSWARSVILIDDFAVPGDEGYGFDGYGPGKSLNVEELGRRVKGNYGIFFPKLPSEKETGKRRGCTILAPDPQDRKILSQQDLLVSFPGSTP